MPVQDLTPEQYDQWFKAKVQEALDDPGPGIPLDEAFKYLEARLHYRLTDVIDSFATAEQVPEVDFGPAKGKEIC